VNIPGGTNKKSRSFLKSILKKTRLKLLIPLVVITLCLLSVSALYYFVFWMGTHSHPAWSPDGRYIAYEFYNSFVDQIVVMDADGRNKRVVAKCRGADSPVWSPDGTKIAFSCIMGWADHNWSYLAYKSIFIVGVDGSNETQLTYGNFTDQSYQWSPDGDAIVFVSTRDARVPGPMDPINWDIYLVNPGDGEITHLVDNPSPDINPAWSHDGGRIAYVPDNSGNGGSPVSVDGSDASGGSIVIINREGELLDVLSGSGVSLSWSPDGTLISFDNGQGVYSIEIESGKRTQVSDAKKTIYPPYGTFSPDGNWVAFSYELGRGSNLFSIDLRNGTLHQITANEAIESSPTWAPDGSQIAFESTPKNSVHDQQIYTIASDGSDQKCLTCPLWGR
jgi:Tol biopolymer transport system component